MPRPATLFIQAFRHDKLYPAIALIENACWHGAKDSADVVALIQEGVATLAQDASGYPNTLEFCRKLLAAVEARLAAHPGEGLQHVWFLRTVILTSGWAKNRDPGIVVADYFDYLHNQRLDLFVRTLEQVGRSLERSQSRRTQIDIRPSGAVRVLAGAATLGISELFRDD